MINRMTEALVSDIILKSPTEITFRQLQHKAKAAKVEVTDKGKKVEFSGNRIRLLKFLKSLKYTDDDLMPLTSTSKKNENPIAKFAAKTAVAHVAKKLSEGATSVTLELDKDMTKSDATKCAKAKGVKTKVVRMPTFTFSGSGKEIVKTLTALDFEKDHIEKVKSNDEDQKVTLVQPQNVGVKDMQRECKKNNVKCELDNQMVIEFSGDSDKIKDCLDEIGFSDKDIKKVK